MDFALRVELAVDFKIQSLFESSLSMEGVCLDQYDVILHLTEKIVDYCTLLVLICRQKTWLVSIFMVAEYGNA